MAQLESEDGHWRSTGHDPQMLLSLPAARAAGAYRFRVLMEGDAIDAPCIYLDHGQGWGEASRHALQPGDGGLDWLFEAELPAFTADIRFDPCERPGTFRLHAATLEPLGDATALLAALARHAAQDPPGLPARVSAARRVAAAEGLPAALRSLAPDVTGGATTGGHAGWVERHDAIHRVSPAVLEAVLARLTARPLVSLVLPVAGAEPVALRACLDAIEAQAYPDWELLLVAGPDATGPVASLLEAAASRSSRVRIVAPVDALRTSAGRFLALLAVDCILAPHALLALVDAALRTPDASVVYGDSDRVDAAGLRLDPDFKPDWDPVLLTSGDYLAPVALFAAGRVHAVGGLPDAGAGGAHHDLALRCTEGLDARRIVHVPLILASERGGESLSSGRAGTSGGRRAVEAHFERLGVRAEVEARAVGYRVRRTLPSPAPSVTLVIPTRDRLDLLRRSVEGILARSTYPAFEILIVDNQSVEAETLAWFESVQADARVRVLRHDAPFNYSAINNAAVAATDAEIVGLVNNDVDVISPDWIETLVGHALDPAVGAVGAMLYYPDDTIQHAGVVVGLGGVAGHSHAHLPRGSRRDRGWLALARGQGAVTAACLFVRRETYLAVGGFDTSLAVAFNDIDFCLRLGAAGFLNVWTPHAELYHHESASRGREDDPVKQARFQSEVERMQERWRHALVLDPHYHPALSLEVGSDFTPATIPRASLRQWLSGLLPERGRMT